MAPTKQEIAEGLTVAQLRELADREGVDLTGLSTKDEIVAKVTASVPKDALQPETGDAGSNAETPPTADATDPSAPDVAADRPTLQSETDELAAKSPFDVGNQGQGTTNWSPGVSAPTPGATTGEVEAPWADEELPPLGPPNPEPVTADAGEAPRNESGQVANDPESLQKARLSPADLEVPSLGPGGAEILVKQNPETPSAHQVVGAVGTTRGPVEQTVTVTDGDGNEVPHRLGTDDHALIASRAAATNPTHPAHTTEGHWSNPALRDMTNEEREADARAYAERFGK